MKQQTLEELLENIRIDNHPGAAEELKNEVARRFTALEDELEEERESTDCARRDCKDAQQKAQMLRNTISEVHAWAVCAAITAPDDMAQNFPRIVEITAPDVRYPDPTEKPLRTARQLRAALAALVSTDDPIELRNIEDAIGTFPGSAEEKAAILNAINLLLTTEDLA